MKKIALLFENENSKYKEPLFEFGKKLLCIHSSEILLCDTFDYSADFLGIIFVFDIAPNNSCEKINKYIGVTHIKCIWGEKLQNAFEKTLLSMAGIPAPLEIERKFLIKYPDIQKLSSLDNCKKSSMCQMYLDESAGDGVRIRKTLFKNITTYVKTEKKKISPLVRIEKESFIEKDEYERLALKKHNDYAPILKDRYYLLDNGKYFEIDIFPFWSEVAFMEIELTSEDEAFHIPHFIEVIRDLSCDSNFTNRAISKKLNLSDTIPY